MAGKVTVGLASHRPCVTDSVVYPPTGSMACDREMSTLPLEYYGIFTFCMFIRFALLDTFKHCNIIMIMIMINNYDNNHKAITSQVLQEVELVGKGEVKRKSFEPRFENCQKRAFKNCLN